MTKRRQYLYIKPAKKGYSTIDHLQDEFDEEWLEKARKLQARRWHKLRNEVQGVDYYREFK